MAEDRGAGVVQWLRTEVQGVQWLRTEGLDREVQCLWQRHVEECSGVGGAMGHSSIVALAVVTLSHQALSVPADAREDQERGPPAALQGPGRLPNRNVPKVTC